jgi:hypothetical protein
VFWPIHWSGIPGMPNVQICEDIFRWKAGLGILNMSDKERHDKDILNFD